MFDASKDANLYGLISDEMKLQSFLDNALTPLVSALRDQTALAGWEIINEPEGSFQISSSNEPCFDTSSVLSGSGAGWTGGQWPIKDVLRFINRQAAAIHAADPKSLVTVGSWSQYASTDASGDSLGDGGRKFRNFYKDECLQMAGGQEAGVLDFFQM